MCFVFRVLYLVRHAGCHILLSMINRLLQRSCFEEVAPVGAARGPLRQYLGFRGQPLCARSGQFEAIAYMPGISNLLPGVLCHKSDT
jgi:hypothetical protein